MNIHIKSGEHKELVHIIDSHFNIPSLNSKEKYKIIFDNVYTHLTEITWLKCYIEAADKGIIDLFQFDVANKEAVSLTLENELGWWQDTLFISSQFERQQLRTNKILVFLTAITLIQGLWGLKEFVRFFWNSLIFLLFSIWHGIISTIHFFSNIKHP